jgi:Ca2+-binding RTX toxin-like protein
MVVDDLIVGAAGADTVAGYAGNDEIRGRAVPTT